MSKIGKRKKGITAFLLILLLFAACKADPPEQQAATEVSTFLTEQTIAGVAQDVSMNTLTLLTEQGAAYVFRTQTAELIQAVAPYENGAQVCLTYTGRLGSEQTLQQVTVLRIEVLASPVTEVQATAAPTEPPTAAPPADPAEQILTAMTLEEKVGQMFIARCPQNDGAALASQYALGGYILFARDFQNQTKESVTANIQSYQRASKVKMLIGVDEEGGGVNRLSQFPSFREVPFQSPQTLFAIGGFERIAADTAEKATLLKSLGINLNFAPVCDVSVNQADFIFSRSFGRSAQETAQYVQTVVTGNLTHGIGSVLKHFPGYGNNGDSHIAPIQDSRPLDQFRAEDFLPFQSGIAAGAPCVLVAHNIMAAVDGVNPASLSPAVHTLLRDELGFTGVVITDDLAMGAIKQYTPDANAAVMAVLAGNDMLTCTNFAEQIPGVIAAVQVGQITEERINASVLRILKWKMQLGLLS